MERKADITGLSAHVLFVGNITLDIPFNREINMTKKVQKDYGRQNLYSAEEASNLWRFAEEGFDSVKQCQAYVDRVLETKWWKKRYKHIKHIFVYKRSYAWSYAEERPPTTENMTEKQKNTKWQGAINLTRFSMDKCTILHELAHFAVGLENGHNEDFCTALLAINRRFLGVEAATILEKNYKKHNVKYK
jgi:putative metallohydrolase (TIGR04338 family)